MSHSYNRRDHGPNNPESYYNLGTDLSELGRDAQAVPEFQYCLALNAAYLPAYNNLAISLARTDGSTKPSPRRQRA